MWESKLPCASSMHGLCLSHLWPWGGSWPSDCHSEPAYVPHVIEPPRGDTQWSVPISNSAKGSWDGSNDPTRTQSPHCLPHTRAWHRRTALEAELPPLLTSPAVGTVEVHQGLTSQCPPSLVVSQPCAGST